MLTGFRSAIALSSAALAIALAGPAAAQFKPALNEADHQPEIEAPVPAIAVGMAVFNAQRVSLGYVKDIVTQGGQQVALVTKGSTSIGDSGTVALPFDRMMVVDGVLFYDISSGAFANRPTVTAPETRQRSMVSN